MSRQTRPDPAEILDMPDKSKIPRSTTSSRRLHKGYLVGGGEEAAKVERLETKEGHSDM